MRSRPADHTLARFVAPKAIPSQSVGLRPDHPALSEGRTLFPSTVVSAADSPRVLISGKNNPKLGADVRKGPLRGFPIYQLSLEERATCPRSCAVWAECYGNGMHLARRHRAGRDLELRLIEEVADLAVEHPGGFLVRLHTLGDFYSADYVRFWGRLLDACPQLHCFGFTARSEFGDDDASRETAAEIYRLTDRHWARFAIRFSRPGTGAQGATVVDRQTRLPGVIMCPAQTGGTAACATCGLCWSVAARDKTIAFLRHGMRRARGPRRPRPLVAPARPIRLGAPETPITAALIRLAASGDSIAVRALARKRTTFGAAAE